MMPILSPIHIEIPDWLVPPVDSGPSAMPDIADRMHFVIRLSRQNIEHRTGGPFAAAIFERGSGRLIAPGVNLVTSSNLSIAHAEIMAITLAQQAMGTRDLSACELVTSCEPCAMCFGAVPWCGVTRLVCGARSEDAARAGFDEGEKASDWAGALARRGIEVVRDVCRAEAAAVLADYTAQGGEMYNGGNGQEIRNHR
jgi:tRNA(Arg) A34 adenosine deaminase TadA